MNSCFKPQPTPPLPGENLETVSDLQRVTLMRQRSVDGPSYPPPDNANSQQPMGSSCSSASSCRDVGTKLDLTTTLPSPPQDSVPPWAQMDSEGSVPTQRSSRRNNTSFSQVLNLTPRTFTRATDDDCAALRSERAHRVDWAVQGLMERKRAAAQMTRRYVQARAVRRATTARQRVSDRRGSGPNKDESADRSASMSCDLRSPVLDTWRGAGSTEAPFNLLLNGDTALGSLPHQRLSTTRAFSDCDLNSAD